jgi:hypothetical protein
MKNDLENISSLIEGYFNQTLNIEEQQELSAILSNNANAQQIFDNERALRTLMIENEMIDLKNQMKKDLSAPSFSSKYLFYGIGAITIATSFILYLATQNSGNNTNMETLQIIEIAEVNAVIAKQDTAQNKSSQTKEQPISNSQDVEKTSQTNNLAFEMTVNPDLKNELEPLNNTEEVARNQISDNTTKMEQPETPDKEVSAEKTEPLNCLNFKPNYTISITQPESDTDNGAIEIHTNESNLLFKLKQDKSFGLASSFGYLSDGVYAVEIQCEQGCVHETKPIQLKASLCPKENNVILNLQRHETWNYLNNNSHAVVQILNKFHQPILESSINTNSSFNWDGYTSSGKQAEQGLYKAIIKFDNGEICIINITIIN